MIGGQAPLGWHLTESLEKSEMSPVVKLSQTEEEVIAKSWDGANLYVRGTWMRPAGQVMSTMELSSK